MKYSELLIKALSFEEWKSIQVNPNSLGDCWGDVLKPLKSFAFKTNRGSVLFCPENGYTAFFRQERRTGTFYKLMEYKTTDEQKVSNLIAFTTAWLYDDLTPNEKHFGL